MGLERLLEETPEAYYWMGFLFADGYFSNVSGNHCMIVHLAAKDKEHVVNLSRFVNVGVKEKNTSWTHKGIKKTSKGYRLEKWDVVNVSAIVLKFKILPKKTYNPPVALYIEDDDLFLAFVIGFIDGDGCIDKQGCLHVQCHKSWNGLLEQWFNRVYAISAVEVVNKVQKTSIKCNIDKRDDSGKIEIYNNDVLMFLKQKTEDLSLPVLARKWDRIVQRKRYTRDSDAVKKSIKDLICKGFTQKEIAAKIRVHQSYVAFVKGGEKR